MSLEAKELGLVLSPNPFNGNLVIKFEIEGNIGQDFSLVIYDATGRLVRQWDYKTIRQKDYVVWDAKDSAGQRLPAGVYFVKLAAKGFNKVAKVVVLR